MLFVLAMCTTAIAGPECNTYSMNYKDNLYELSFSCETAGIGSVEAIFNKIEYRQWYLYFYFYSETPWVMIPKLGTFELIDNTLYHIYQDLNTGEWYRSGFIFINIVNEEDN
jgi:hypothetical protein